MQQFIHSYFRFVRHLLPDASSSDVLGIDISASFCKGILISVKNEIVTLEGLVAIPVEGGDEKAAVTRLMGHFGKSDKPRDVVFSVGGKGTLVRYIDMPRMSSRDLGKAFAIEADKYFPFPRDTIYTACHILDPKSQDKKMAVLVAAVKKEVVDTRIRLLREASVDPTVVTLGPVAVANVFAVFPPGADTSVSSGKEDDSVALIDIGEAGTNLMIVGGGIPRFSRDIFIGITEIVRRIANVAGVSSSDARTFLYQVAARPEAAQKALEAVVAALVSEVRLSFDYFVTEKDMSITRLYLMGDGLMIPSLEEMFAQGVDVPAAFWNPLESLNMSPGVDRNMVHDTGRTFITALGLALNEYDNA